MRCVSYTRATSSFIDKNPPDHVIAWQNEQISEYVKNNNLKILKRYSDRKEERDAQSGFLELKEDGLQRKFDMVIMQSVYRAGKGVPFAEDTLLKIFYPLGIHFVFVEDCFESWNHSEKDIKAYFKKKKYRALRSVESEKNKNKFLEGYFTVHDEKYGYILSDDCKSFSVDEEAAAVIREIFTLIAEENRTNNWIAKYFNQKGYESPIQRKARIGKKHVGNEIVPWRHDSIRNIINNPSYIGVGTKEFSGEKFTYQLPPIVSKELYEKVQQVQNSRKLKKVNTNQYRNPFAFFIVDRDTKEKLYCTKYGKNATHDFRFKTDYHKETCENSIPYKEVMEKVVEAIRSERQAACNAYQQIMEKKNAGYLQQYFEQYQKSAQSLFEKLCMAEQPNIPLYLEYEEDEITEDEYRIQREVLLDEMNEAEEKFTELMIQYEEQVKALGESNPWILYYKDAVVSDELTREEFQKWGIGIEVEKFKTVHVIFKHEKWRNLLPKEWIKGGGVDGTNT